MRTSIISDLHFAYVNHGAVEKWLEHVKETQPDRVIINGDLLDCEKLAHFDQVPDFGETYDNEIAYARLFLKSLREIYKDKIDIIEGNHSMRLKQLVWKNAQALSGMSGFTIPERLGLKELDIEWHDVQEGAARFVDNFIEDQGYLVGHYNAAKKGSGNTVRGLLDKYGMNIVQGHVHRLGIVIKRVYDKQLIGIECGCMCNINPKWMKYPDWCVGWVDIVDGLPELHPII